MTNTPGKKRLILVAGPTAVGKTSVAIAIAKRYGTAIISADSRQCFREMKIGVARPSDAELAAVQHYFVASHSIHDDLNAAFFERYALDKLEQLFAGHDVVVMAGGTGLYIKAFTDGLDPMPPINPALRQQLRADYEAGGITWLTARLTQLDPLFAASGEMMNPQRMLRALEVIESTGQSILSFHKDTTRTRDFDIIRIGLELPRNELNERINHRVQVMMQDGQLEEARRLLPFRHLNALSTVGYMELFDHLDGVTELSEAVNRIAIHTRQYAKRQMTWFKKDGDYKWFDPHQLSSILEYTDLAINL